MINKDEWLLICRSSPIFVFSLKYRSVSWWMFRVEECIFDITEGFCAYSYNMLSSQAVFDVHGTL